MSRLYIRIIISEIPFIAILSGAFLILLVSVIKAGMQPGGFHAMTTAAVVTLFGSFNSVIFIMAIFYSGELIWYERDSGFNQIADTLPVDVFINLSSKFLALAFLYAMMLIFLTLCGIFIQTAFGYQKIDTDVLLVNAFLSTLPGLLLWTFLSVFIQVLINNKFLGFSVCVVVALFLINLENMGIENELFRFGSGTLVPFSPMNGYQSFLLPFLVLKIYWLSFGGLLFMAAILFYPRGTEPGLFTRMKEAARRVTRPWTIGTLTILVVLIAAGMTDYVNTRYVGTFESPSEALKKRSEYEKKFAGYRKLPQPRITEAVIFVRLFPEQRAFELKGTYTLMNNSAKPLSEILVQENLDPMFHPDKLVLSKPASVKSRDLRDRVYRIKLITALAPGEKMTMSFGSRYQGSGFLTSGLSKNIVENGIVLPSSVFPCVGYNTSLELRTVDERTRYGLPRQHADGRDGQRQQPERARFELKVETTNGQTCIAPGELIKTTAMNGRQQFDFSGYFLPEQEFEIVSAKYQVARTEMPGFRLAVYYSSRKDMVVEIGRTTESVVSFCGNLLGPYPSKSLSVIEVPNYNAMPGTYPGVVALNEDQEFTHLKSGPSTISLAEYNLAFAIASQWSGHAAQDYGFPYPLILTKGFPHYLALRYLTASHTREAVMNHNRTLLNSYLSERARMLSPEPPLRDGADFPFLFDTKAALILSRLADYIGHQRLDSSFAEFKTRKPEGENPTQIFIACVNDHVPDSLKYLLHDSFNKVITYENRLTDASYTRLDGGKFRLLLTITGVKNEQKDGKNSPVGFNEWLDLGFFQKNPAGTEKIFEIRKYRIHTGVNRVSIILEHEPVTAQIDPYSLLADVLPDNNLVEARAFVDLTGVEID